MLSFIESVYDICVCVNVFQRFAGRCQTVKAHDDLLTTLSVTGYPGTPHRYCVYMGEKEKEGTGNRRDLPPLYSIPSAS